MKKTTALILALLLLLGALPFAAFSAEEAGAPWDMYMLSATLPIQRHGRHGRACMMRILK